MVGVLSMVYNRFIPAWSGRARRRDEKSRAYRTLLGCEYRKSASSDTTTTLENLESNPKLWPQMAKEASTALAKKMILYTNKTTRTAAEPLM